MSPEQLAADSHDAWLAAVLPASVRTFRASDERLARTLADAGGIAVDVAPDVEIGAARELRGDSRYAIVPVDAAQSEGGSRLVRAPLRLAATVEVRARSRAAGRALRRRGYDTTATVLWDLDHVLYVPEVRARLRGRPLAELLPQRALVRASRGPEEPTLLQAVVGEAGDQGRLSHGWPLARGSGLVVIADGGVLNIVVGPGRRKIEIQQRVLAELSGVPGVVSERLPQTLALGRTGLAEWSLERRMPGTSPSADLPAALVDDVVEFLVALHVHDQAPATADAIRNDAAILAGICTDPGNAARLHALGDQLEEDLADLPRGYGHGDFWTRNLLAVDGRLTGVVDWDGAGGGRLPLLDLLHLLLSAHQERTRAYLGQALTGYLLPSLRAGVASVEAYLRRIGLDLGPERVEQLAIAYWLDRMAQEAVSFADRARRPVWLRHNVDDVVAQLTQRAVPVRF